MPSNRYRVSEAPRGFSADLYDVGEVFIGPAHRNTTARERQIDEHRNPYGQVNLYAGQTPAKLKE